MNQQQKWIEFFSTDKDWIEAKTKIKVEPGKKPTKVEYLKQVGADMYSEKNYRDYINQIDQQEIQEEIF